MESFVMNQNYTNCDNKGWEKMDLRLEIRGK